MRVEHIGSATLILADCMDVMHDMPDKAFEVAIIDPPYGIGGERLNQGAGKLRGRAIQILNAGFDDDPPGAEYFAELERVSKNRIIWGANYFDLPPTRGIICWDKCQPWPNFSQIEIAWTSFDIPAKLIRIDNRTGGKIHPTQKPVALYKWLLKNYTKPGDKILDTHGGSGSSVIACLDMGFEITWIEKDPDYFEAALKRIKDFAAQPKLPMDDTPEPVEQMLGFEETL
jgi:site-specific DNA-methyltransferase (adenine-specific)